jgi:uncharacterized Tic20 family protein
MDAPPPPAAPTPVPVPPPMPLGSNDKLLAILCHISPFLSLPFLLPFIVYLVKKDESPYIAAHAKEAFNFHLSLLLYCICTVPLILVTCGLLIYPAMLLYAAIAILTFVCAIIAAMKTSDGGFFYYPLTIRFF